jgi:hypothetical protein
MLGYRVPHLQFNQLPPRRKTAMAELKDEGSKELPTNRRGIALFSLSIKRLLTGLRYPQFRDSVQTQGCDSVLLCCWVPRWLTVLCHASRLPLSRYRLLAIANGMSRSSTPRHLRPHGAYRVSSFVHANDEPSLVKGQPQQYLMTPITRFQQTKWPKVTSRPFFKKSINSV